MGNQIDGTAVLVMKCETYERDKIERIVRDGMERFNYKPAGKVFVKPNVVFAYDTKKFGDAAYTSPPLVEASLSALSKQQGVKRVDMGENSAVGFPTRLCYKNAGYYDVMKRVRKQAPVPVGIFCMDEEKRDSVFVGGKVHDNIRLSTKMARADSMVYLPRLKCHCVSAMTGAVKLNIGICSDDERSIRHDFLLNEKIVDLLSVGYPDFIVMDAIDVGMGNEAFPTVRKLGLIIMGKNPLAVDLVGSRLLGLELDDVAYLKTAVERGYTPSSIDEITIDGDLKNLDEVDEYAKRLQPYDDEFFRWQDVQKELDRMNSPMKFYWGPYRHGNGEKCLTGCVMGLKMFLGSIERYAGAEAFAFSKPVIFVIGRYYEKIDAKGKEVFLLGSCAKAEIVNAKKVIHLDKCFTTAGDMNLALAKRLGIPVIVSDPVFMLKYTGSIARASIKKIVGMRYLQDFGHFVTKGLIRRI